MTSGNVYAPVWPRQPVNPLIRSSYPKISTKHLLYPTQVC